MVINFSAAEYQEKMAVLRERLLIAEKERMAGEMISLDEAEGRLKGKFDGKI